MGAVRLTGGIGGVNDGICGDGSNTGGKYGLDGSGKNGGENDLIEGGRGCTG